MPSGSAIGGVVLLLPTLDGKHPGLAIVVGVRVRRGEGQRLE